MPGPDRDRPRGRLPARRPGRVRPVAPPVRTRLLPLLIVLMAGVLLALGFPLAVSVAAAQQQRVVVDRIDDTARFAALAQFVTAATSGSAATPTDERRLHDPAHRTRPLPRRCTASGPASSTATAAAMAAAPDELAAARRSGEGARGLPARRCSAAAATTRRRCGRGSARRLAVASPGRPGRGRGRRRRHRLAHRRAALADPARLAAASRAGEVRRDAASPSVPRSGSPAGCCGPYAILDARHPRHRHRPDEVPGRGRRRTARNCAPGPLVQRDGRQRRGRAGAAARLRRRRLAPAAQPARRAAAAHRAARRWNCPEGNEEIASVRTEGKRLAQVLDDLLGPGAGRARRGRPRGSPTSARWPPSGSPPGGRSPRQKGVAPDADGRAAGHRPGPTRSRCPARWTR